MSEKSRVERDGVGCYGKRSQKRLWNKVGAASFGFGTGKMLGGKTGCGRVSEEVGTLNLMLGSCLLSMTLLIRCPINWVVFGVKIVFNIHCLDFLQCTCLNRGSPVNDKEYDCTENLNEDLSSRLLSPGID